MTRSRLSLNLMIEMARSLVLAAFDSDNPRVRSDAVRWLDALCDTAKGQALVVRNRYGIGEKEMMSGWVMRNGKHDGEDDKQTDHTNQGSDGHTVESGDEK